MLIRNDYEKESFKHTVDETCDFSEKKIYVGSIELKLTDRSLAQNRLAFKWYDELGRKTGHGKEYERHVCKWHVGFPILLANDKDGQFTKFYDNLISNFEYEQVLDAMEFVEVTRLMTVSQFAEYLTTIEQKAALKGYVLSRPEDIYNEAMGRYRL